MGFYSTVIIAISKTELATQLLLGNKLPSMLNNESLQHETDYGKYWIFEELKWYYGYPEIDEVENYLKKIEDDANFAKCKLNEDGSYEYEGHPWNFELEQVSSINTPWGKVYK